MKQVKAFCELNSVQHRLIKKLSKGFQQRVGIAQAIVHNPSAIILDEPTNGLDPTQIKEMRDLIVHLRSQAGVLLSTHQLNDVEEVCNSVHMIKTGCTVVSKKISDLKQTNKIRIRFANKIPVQALDEFPNVTQVQCISSSTVELKTSDDLDTLKHTLLKEAQTKDWHLLEIYDVQDNLENIFVSEVLRSTN